MRWDKATLEYEDNDTELLDEFEWFIYLFIYLFVHSFIYLIIY